MAGEIVSAWLVHHSIHALLARQLAIYWLMIRSRLCTHSLVPFILERLFHDQLIKNYDIICAGNYTKDTIITPDGTRYVDGGGMNYAAHAAMRLGLKTAMVTRLAQEDEHVVDDIRRDGIDCYPFYSPSSTLMTLEYKTHDVDKRNLYVKGVAGTIRPEHLDGLEARAIVVSPSLRGEVEPEFFTSMRKRKGVILSADVQGFVRVLRGEALVYEPWGEMPSGVQGTGYPQIGRG